jgi:hypothetical protein
MKTVIIDIDGQKIVATEKTFSTGSVGYYASAKIVIDGAIHQCGINIVKAGSKPESKKKK